MLMIKKKFLWLNICLSFKHIKKGHPQFYKGSTGKEKLERNSENESYGNIAA